MATGLELYDKEGEVVDNLPEDTDDSDELEAALSTKETTAADSEGDEESPTEGEGEGEGKTEGTPKEGDEKPAEGEEKVVAPDGEEKPEPPKEEKEETPTPTDEEENQNLRAVARDQKKELAFLKARLERLEKSVVTEPEEGQEPLKPARVEELQAVINDVVDKRGPMLEVLVETMEQNPNYADIRTVCSQNNFNYLVSAAADAIAEKEDRDSVEVALELEAAIWSEANPYKTMYEMIKQFHPKYAKPAASEEKAPVVKEEKPAEEKPAEKKPVKEPVKAPASVATAGTGSNISMAGWTAERIDQLDELDLGKVPKEVYEAYLRGELDK